jgi:thiamine biosynthesis lipoprotein ApbE
MTVAVNGIGIAEGRALGCGLRIVTTDPAAIDSARGAVDVVLAAVDAACSRFRTDSELTALNASPGRSVEVSPLLAQAIAAALRAAQMTQGAVDPTVGVAIRVAGYDRDFATMPADGDPLRLVARPVPGWQAVDFEERARRIRLPPGVELDLGATGKALAADLAAGAAFAATGCGVLVSLGGDIAAKGAPPKGGWAIQVSEDSGAAIGAGEEVVRIREGAIATSSTTVRRWTRGGVALHHIIDPRTGLPAAGPWRTATVAARSCVDANTVSTAAVVLGPAALEEMHLHTLPARLVDQDGRILRLGGWPAPRA